jgi:hypothetical protein
MIYRSYVRVHQHDSGRKGGREKQETGRSRGGYTTKIHAVFDALGNPIRYVDAKEDWVHQVKRLVDKDYPYVDVILLVTGSLNTHMLGTHHSTFAPEEAFRISSRIEIHNTPNHGNWLKINECELSELTYLVYLDKTATRPGASSQ